MSNRDQVREAREAASNARNIVMRQLSQVPTGGGVLRQPLVMTLPRKRVSEVIDLISSSDEDEPPAALPANNRASSAGSTNLVPPIASAGSIYQSHPTPRAMHSPLNSLRPLIINAAGTNRSGGLSSSSAKTGGSSFVDLVDSDDDYVDDYDGQNSLLSAGFDQNIFDCFNESPFASSIARVQEQYPRGFVGINDYYGSSITGSNGALSSAALTSGTSVTEISNRFAAPIPSLSNSSNTSTTFNANNSVSASNPSSSSKKPKIAETSLNPSASMTSTIVRVKTEFPPVGFGEADIEGELTEIPLQGEISPSKNTSALATGSSRLSTGGNSKSADDSDDDDIEVIGDSVLSISDMPHSRESCSVYKFSAAATFAKAFLFCHNCYCYVCEIKASECQDWKTHCFANCKDSKWKSLRVFCKNPLLRLLPVKVTMEIQIRLKDVVKDNMSHYEREFYSNQHLKSHYKDIEKLLTELDRTPFSRLIRENKLELVEELRNKSIIAIHLLYQVGILTSMEETCKTYLFRLLIHTLLMKDIQTAIYELPTFDYWNRVNSKATLNIRDIIHEFKIPIASLVKYFNRESDDLSSGDFILQIAKDIKTSSNNSRDDQNQIRKERESKILTFFYYGVNHWLEHDDSQKEIKIFEFIQHYYKFSKVVTLGIYNYILRCSRQSDSSCLESLRGSLGCIAKQNDISPLKIYLSNELDGLLLDSKLQQLLESYKFFEIKNIDDFVKAIPLKVLMLVTCAISKSILRSSNEAISQFEVSEELKFSSFLKEAIERLIISPALSKAEYSSSFVNREMNESVSILDLIRTTLGNIDLRNFGDKSSFYNKFFYEASFESANLATVDNYSEEEWRLILISYLINSPWFSNFDFKHINSVSHPNGISKFLPSIRDKRMFMVLSTVYGFFSQHFILSVSLFLWRASLVESDLNDRMFTLNCLPDHFKIYFLEICWGISNDNYSDLLHNASYSENIFMCLKPFFLNGDVKPLTHFKGIDKLLLMSLGLNLGKSLLPLFAGKSDLIQISNFIRMSKVINEEMLDTHISLDHKTSKFIFSFDNLDKEIMSQMNSAFIEVSPPLYLKAFCVSLVFSPNSFHRFIMPTILGMSSQYAYLSVYPKEGNLIRDSIPIFQKDIDNLRRTISTEFAQQIPLFALHWIWISNCNPTSFVNSSISIDVIRYFYSMSIDCLISNGLSVKIAIDSILLALDQIPFGCDRSNFSLEAFPDSFLFSLAPKEAHDIIIKGLDLFLIKRYISSIIRDSSYTKGANKYLDLLLLIKNISKAAKSRASSIDLNDQNSLTSYEFNLIIQLNNFDLVLENVAGAELNFNDSIDKPSSLKVDQNCFIASGKFEILKFCRNKSSLQFFDFLEHHISIIAKCFQSSLNNSVAALKSAKLVNEIPSLPLQKELNNISGMGDILLVSYLVNYSIKILSVYISYIRMNFSKDMKAYLTASNWMPLIAKFKQIVDEYYSVMSESDLAITTSKERIMLTAVMDSYDFSTYPIGFIVFCMMSGTNNIDEVKQTVCRILADVQFEIIYLESLILEYNFLVFPSISKFNRYIAFVKDVNNNLQINTADSLPRDISLIRYSPLSLSSDITSKLNINERANNLAIYMWNMSFTCKSDVSTWFQELSTCNTGYYCNRLFISIMIKHFPLAAIERYIHIHTAEQNSILSYKKWVNDDGEISEMIDPELLLKLEPEFGEGLHSGNNHLSYNLTDFKEFVNQFKMIYGFGPASTTSDYNTNVVRVILIKKLLISCLTFAEPYFANRLVQVVKLLVAFISKYIDCEYVYFLRPNMEAVFKHLQTIVVIVNKTSQNMNINNLMPSGFSYSFFVPSYLFDDKEGHYDCLLDSYKGPLSFIGINQIPSDQIGGSISNNSQASVLNLAGELQEYFSPQYCQEMRTMLPFSTPKGQFPGKSYASDYGEEKPDSASYYCGFIHDMHFNGATVAVVPSPVSMTSEFIDVTNFCRVIMFLAFPSIENFHELSKETWFYTLGNSDEKKFYEKLQIFCFNPTKFDVFTEVCYNFSDFRPLYSTLSRLHLSKSIKLGLISAVVNVFKPKIITLLQIQKSPEIFFDFLFGEKGLITNMGAWFLIHDNISASSDSQYELFSTPITSGLYEVGLRGELTYVQLFLAFVVNPNSSTLTAFLQAMSYKINMLSTANLKNMKFPSADTFLIMIFEKISKVVSMSLFKFSQLLAFHDSLSSLAATSEIASRIAGVLYSPFLALREEPDKKNNYKWPKYINCQTLLGLSQVISKNNTSKSSKVNPTLANRLFNIFSNEIFIAEHSNPSNIVNYKLATLFSSEFEPVKDMAKSLVGSDILSKCLSSIIQVWIFFSSRQKDFTLATFESKELKSYIESGFSVIDQIINSKDENSQHIFSEYVKLICQFYLFQFNELREKRREFTSVCQYSFDCLMHIAGLIPNDKRFEYADLYLKEFQQFIVESVQIEVSNYESTSIFPHIINNYLKRAPPSDFKANALIETKKEIFSSMECLWSGVFEHAEFHIFRFQPIGSETNYRTNLLMLYRRIPNQKAVLNMFTSKLKKIVESCEYQRIDERVRGNITETLKAFKYYYQQVNLPGFSWAEELSKVIKSSCKKKSVKDVLSNSF